MKVSRSQEGRNKKPTTGEIEDFYEKRRGRFIGKEALPSASWLKKRFGWGPLNRGRGRKNRSQLWFGHPQRVPLGHRTGSSSRELKTRKQGNQGDEK